MNKTISLREAVDIAVVEVYKMVFGTEFTINSLYNNTCEEFDFNKKNLAVVPSVLVRSGLAVKTGRYARTFSNGRVAGMAAVYMRVAK